MKIAFASNFMNHHQLPLCDALAAIPGVELTFVATERLPESRQRLGYAQLSGCRDYCLEALDRPGMRRAEQIMYESDAALIGSAPAGLIRRRIREGKLTFQYGERLFKEGMLNHPGDIVRGLWHHTRRRGKNVFMLCAGGFMAPDCRMIGAYPGRLRRFGYFPQVKAYPAGGPLDLKSSGRPRLLWVGRFLAWKRPYDFLKVCQGLLATNTDFEAEMLGSGELEAELSTFIAQNGLAGRVSIVTGLNPEGVRNRMEAADIFLFTSDRREGWGAVLGEAMNSGCAVVASRAAGATPFLVREGENGLTCYPGDVQCLLEKTKALIRSPQLRLDLGRNAVNCLTHLWNAEVAASRLHAFSQAFLKDQPLPNWEDGPMGKC